MQKYSRILIRLCSVIVIVILSATLSLNMVKPEVHHEEIFYVEAPKTVVLSEAITKLDGQDTITLGDLLNQKKWKDDLLVWTTQRLYETHYTQDQIQRAQEIYTHTPLDIETSLYLIYYCDLYSVDPALVLSIIEVESNFDERAVGTSRDRGLMQIIPSTERWLVKDYGEELGFDYNPDQIFEPEYHLGLAIRYIAHLKERYGANIHRALSEYNRGPKHLNAYYETHNTYQTSYSRSILSRVKKYHFNED
jgi:hypothetical protein